MKHSSLVSETVKDGETNNLILNFPDELLNEDWIELQKHIPGDQFLYGVFHWILTNQQEPLNDLLEEAVSRGDVENGKWNPNPDTEALIHKLATCFHSIFSDFLKTIIPKSFSNPRHVKEVMYDVENQDIYLRLEVDDEDERDSSEYTATDLIDRENEEEVDDGVDETADDESSSDELDDSSDEVEDD